MNTRSTERRGEERRGGQERRREERRRGEETNPYLDVSVDDLVVMEIEEALQDLFGVEDDGGLVVLQRTPLRAQEGGEAA